MINLKKYKFVFSAFAMLALVSCDLDVESPNDLEADEVTTELFAVGMYQAYQKVYANEYIVTELRSDNVRSESRSGDLGLADQYAIPSNYNDGRAYWVNNYSVIRNANHILIQEDAIVESESESGRQALAEAYFMRALSHFNLVRAFRRVPYIDAVINVPADLLAFPTLNFNEDFDSALQSVYTRIINDFGRSIEFFNQIDNGEVVRNKANLPAAYGFLVKALLSQPQKDFGGALSILNTHLHPDTNTFGLDLVNLDLDDRESAINEYIDIFQKSELNEEILFAVSYEGGNFNDVINQDFNIDDQAQGDAQEWSFEMTDQGSGNGFILSEDLMRLLFVNVEATGLIPEPIRGGDPAVLDTGGIVNTVGNEGFANFTGTTGQVQERGDFYDVKYRDLSESSGIDGVVLRYADILLLFSEAAAEGNDTTSPLAIEMYNKVRSRVGASELVNDGTAFLTQDELLDERRREFTFENQRLWDLIRFKADDGVEVLRDFSIGLTTGDTGFNFEIGRQFLPIPSVEIGLTGGVDVTYSQNASY